MAVVEGHMLTIEALVSIGANFNLVVGRFRNALFASTYRDHTNIIEHLIASGSDMSYRNSSGRTALSIASAYDRIDIAGSLGYYSEKD